MRQKRREGSFPAAGDDGRDTRPLKRIPHPYHRRVRHPRKAQGRSQNRPARPELQRTAPHQ